MPLRSEFVYGDEVWRRVAAMLPNTGRRHAAVAYLGANANDYLRLRRNDVLVFDGSDQSVAANHVDLKQVEAMLRTKVRVYSLPALHTKALLVEGPSATAVIGSANASQHSVDALFEAMLVTTDPQVVDDVRVMVTEWSADEDRRVDKAWLAHARSIPRAKRHAVPRKPHPKTRPPTDPSRPLWLIDTERTAHRARAEVGAALDREEASNPLLYIEELPGSYGWYGTVAEGDSVLLIPWSSNGRSVRSNAVIWEPAKVVRKVPHARGSSGTLLLAYRPGAQARYWSEVTEALNATGSDAEVYEADRPGRKALFDLFGSSR